MIKTYIIKHALRSLDRMRTYTLINLVGLVISLTGAIIIARYVHQELTVNHYVPELDRTFILLNHGGYEDNIHFYHDEVSNVNNIENWQNPYDDPDVECHTTFCCAYGGLDIVSDDVHYQVDAVVTDSMFLQLLPRKVVAGSMTLKEKTDAIITCNFADRMWPGESAIGKTLLHDGNALNVVGVVEQPDTKYSFGFDILLHRDFKELMYAGWSIVRLREGADYKEYNRRRKPFSETFPHTSEKYIRHYQLFPLDKAYFDSPFKDYAPSAEKFYPQGNKQNIAFLIGGAVLLLLVGLFNYFNIFSILAIHRRKGIAVRKIFGASTTDVFWMLFMENFLLTAFAVAVAWAVISLASPLLVKYYNVQLLASPVFDIFMSLFIALLLPLVVSTSVTLWSRNKSTNDDMKLSGAYGLSRSVSLWLQYTFTFFLVLVSSFSVHQLYFMLHSDLGYCTENIVWFDLFPAIRNQNAGGMTHEEWEHREEMMQKAKDHSEDYMRRIKESPLFTQCCFGNESASLTSQKVSIDDWGTSLKADIPGHDYQRVAEIHLRPEQMEMYGLKLLEGPKPDVERDSYNKYRMYLSRSAKERLGVKDIATTHIQPSSRLWYGIDENGEYLSDNPAYTIVGVYDDFCMTHLGMDDIPSFITITAPEFYEYSYFLAKYQPGKRKEAMAFLQKLYEEENGTGSVMPHRFIEDEIAEIYTEDARVARIFTTFALLSIAISCLGLFGISLYDVRSRRREIALRKVHGAKFKDIFRLIARRYLIALGVAILVGTPLAIYALHFYIQGYVHHVPLTPWYFILASLLMFLLTLATVYWQIRKAARENPADVMKSE